MSDESEAQPSTTSQRTEKMNSIEKAMSVKGTLGTECSDGTKNAHLFHFSGNLM